MIGTSALSIWYSADKKLFMEQSGRLLGTFHKIATECASVEKAPSSRITSEKSFMLKAILLYKASLYKDAKKDYDALDKLHGGIF